MIEALKKITRSIPIVFALVNDPVGQGFAKSLSHPGGNITGFTFTNPEMIGKWVGLLKDMAPGITRAALLFNPSTALFYPNFLHEIGTTRRLAVTELVLTPVDTLTEMETAIDALAQKPGSSLIIGPDVFNIGHIKQIAQLAGKNPAAGRLGVPAVSGRRRAHGVRAGYGGRIPPVRRLRGPHYQGREPGRSSGARTDQVRVGHQPQDRQGLGLTVPQTLLATADEVIE